MIQTGKEGENSRREKKSGNSSEKGLEKKGGNHVWDDMQFSAKIPLRRSKGPFFLFFPAKKTEKR